MKKPEESKGIYRGKRGREEMRDLHETKEVVGKAKS
jgi:hypothetical protein